MERDSDVVALGRPLEAETVFYACVFVRRSVGFVVGWRRVCLRRVWEVRPESLPRPTQVATGANSTLVDAAATSGGFRSFVW